MIQLKKSTLFYTILLFLGLLFSACDKDDDHDATPIPSKTIKARLGERMNAATKSFYVDLSTGATTEREVASWDLAFERNGKGILINTGRMASLLNTGRVDFAEVLSKEANTYGKNKAYAFEQIDGDMTKSAVGEWSNADGTSKGIVYVLALGAESSLGYKKWVVLRHTKGISFEIKYANIDGSQEQTKTVALSSKHNFTYFSFALGNTVEVEPENGKWDFALTPVSVKVPAGNSTIRYSFISAQSNGYEGIEVSVNDPLSEKSVDERRRASDGAHKGNYEMISRSDHVSPTTKTNAMGVNPRTGKVHWWDYAGAGKYHVFAFITYTLKDADGNYFALRFVSIKDPSTGKNGTPQLEYRELK